MGNSIRKVKGLKFEVVNLSPNSAQGKGNTITGARIVKLEANVNGVNDFIVLPSLASVPSGSVITIIAGAANCELRTPASSTEEINSENCDGTKEMLLLATQIFTLTKIDNIIGWMGEGRTAIGAYATAVVPD